MATPLASSYEDLRGAPVPAPTLRGPSASAALAPLAALPKGQRARVVDIRADADARGWLEAVGIAVGEEVAVLRRALFGGPVHVRLAAGGEFALCSTLARLIDVTAVADARAAVVAAEPVSGGAPAATSP